MPIPQTGRCERCNGSLPLFKNSGLCNTCLERRKRVDRAAEPRHLREHPDLARFERHLERWYA